MLKIEITIVKNKMVDIILSNFYHEINIPLKRVSKQNSQ